MFAVLTASLACISALPSARSRDGRQEILRTLDRAADAGLRRDVPVLESLYTSDYFHTNPDGSVMGRAAVLATYKQPTEFSFSASRRSEERLQVNGDCAVVSAVVALDGMKNTDPFTSRYRVTYVLHRAGQRWLLANSHATLLGVSPRVP